jgi:hypothetical protein
MYSRKEKLMNYFYQIFRPLVLAVIVLFALGAFGKIRNTEKP